MKKPVKPILVGASLLASFGLTACGPFGTPNLYGSPTLPAAVTEEALPTDPEKKATPEDSEKVTPALVPTKFQENEEDVYGPPPTEFQEMEEDVYGPPPTEYQKFEQVVYGPPSLEETEGKRE